MRGDDRRARICRRRPANPGSERALDVRRKYIEHLLELRGSQQAAQAQGRRECGQRRRGPDRRPARAAPAVRVRQGPPRAGRQFPERRAESRCWRKIARPRSRRCANPARTSASPGTATTTAASSSTSRARFIEGYYIVGLLAEAFLETQPGARIVHDPRLTWNTIDIVLSSSAASR